MDNVEKSKKPKQKLSIIKALRRTIPAIIKTVPGLCLIAVLIGAIHGSTWGLVAPVNQLLYDALADLAIGSGAIRTVFIGAAMVTGLMLLQQVMNAIHNFIPGNVFSQKAIGRLRLQLHKKMKKLPAQVFEDKDKLDDIEKAGEGMTGSVWLYYTLSDALFFYGTYFGVMGVFLWSLEPVLLLAFAMIFAPVAFAQIFEAKLHAMLEEESAPIRRKFAHYEDSLVGLSNMKETRLFGAYHFFKRLFMDSLNLLSQKEWDTQKKISLMYLGLNTFKAIGWLGVLALLFYSLMQGSITVGAFAAVFGSVGMLFGILEEIMWRIRQDLTANLGKIHNYLNFLDIPTMEGDDIPPDFYQGITATDIRFSYPKADKPAVDGVSLHIRPGETLALVGENGSGKTTLVKLLCGLYRPDTGTVVIGGRDTANTAETALFSQTSGVFQDHRAYVFDLADNVKISDTTNPEGDPMPALKNADIDPSDTATFPDGLDTILSREYDGVELSGGQWQRIATARGLYRPHNFIVLDEPTAAIDPLEETRVYNRFAELTRGKIAILVTHRLGSARIAHRIAVMEAGKIVESGTHDELLASKGKYAEMWATQAESYN